MTSVSIIVPAFNVEAFIGECLDSLTGQTLKAIEIIVIDDGSTDRTGGIADAYAARFQNVRVVHKQNGGQSVARNIGLKMAEGEYVLFVDSDDYIVPNACEVLFSQAQKHNVDIVHGDILNVKDRLDSDARFHWSPAEGNVLSGLAYLRESVRHDCYDIVPWLNLTRRALLLDNQLFFREGFFYEDQEYTLRLYTQFPSSVLKLRFPFYYYRLSRPGSTTTVSSLKKGLDIAAIANEMVKYVRQAQLSDKAAMHQVLSLTLYHLAEVWSRLPSAPDREKVIRLLSTDFLHDATLCAFPTNRIRFKNALFCRARWCYCQRYCHGGCWATMGRFIKRVIRYGS